MSASISNLIVFLGEAAYLVIAVGLMLLGFRLIERFTAWLIDRRKGRPPHAADTMLAMGQISIRVMKWLLVAAGAVTLVDIAIQSFRGEP